MALTQMCSILLLLVRKTRHKITMLQLSSTMPISNTASTLKGPKVPQDAPVVCTSTTNLADPANCTSYYTLITCSSTNILQRNDCASGSYFDATSLACAVGSCPANSTTPAPTESTPTESTPTDSTPTESTPTDSTPTGVTPTESTPTVATPKPTRKPKPPTAAPLVCGTPGVFADIADCTKYYVCGTSGTAPFHYTCPDGTHFDPVGGKCIAGVCA